MPPGLLALDNMLYFSRQAPSAYSRVSGGAGWGIDEWGTGCLGGASWGLVMTPQTILCSHLLSLC